MEMGMLQKCLKKGGFEGSSEWRRVTVKLDRKNSGLGKANKYTEKGIKVGRIERDFQRRMKVPFLSLSVD